MSATSIFCGVMATLWALDGLRLRGRAGALQALTPSDEPVSEDHRFLVRPGVALDDETRRAASAFARVHGLDVLDLVPADLTAWRAMLLLQMVDPARYRADRLAKGCSAGEVILVRASLLERMSLTGEAPSDPVAFAVLAAKLKQHACTQTDLAVAPKLRCAPDTFTARGRLVRHLFGDLALPVVVAQLAFALAAPFLALATGVAALGAMHTQCALATLGTKLRPRDRLLYTLVRPLVDLAGVLTRFAPAPAQAEDPVSSRRPIYEGLLAEGTPRFFEARRSDCPICGGTSLTRAVSTRDLYQFKPGTFTLERCSGCAHVFQNPRLSVEGLGFYYKDFYDGLGEGLVEGMFSSSGNPYVARARMLEGAAAPSRWLDVGAGHGHFCCVARDVWPAAQFDGLDLSESIDDAVRKRWIDRGYRGLFPDLAPSLASAEKYDVVSMSHYLEHTRDPAAEIEAAAKVLPSGGHLMIEVPDPDSRFGRIFGSYWMPWFQPQHQHLLSVKNLDRLLRANAFEPVVWHRGEAHQTTDILFLTFTLLSQLARPIDLPWRAPTSFPVRVWHRLVWWAGVPLIAASWVLDRLLAPFLRREGWSNTYRVLARRTA